MWLVGAFAIDLVLANLSNRGYYHYYQTPMPAGLLLAVMLVFLTDWQSECWRRRSERLLGLIGISAGVAIVGFVVLNIAVRGGSPFDGPRLDPLAVYVAQTTAPDETVLIWGASTGINFQSGRRSPTQFTYGYPLVVPDYTTPQDIADFLDDLRRAQPVMIVDTTRSDGRRVPPLDADYRAEWIADGGRADTYDLSSIFAFVAAHCEIAEEIEVDVVYRCTNQG